MHKPLCLTEGQLPPLMSTGQYHILFQGKTSGPFTIEQIKQLLDQKKVGLTHQVQDGENWIFVDDFLNKKEQELSQAKIAADQAKAAQDLAAKQAHEQQMAQIQLEAVQAQAAAAIPPPITDHAGQPAAAPIVPMAPAQSSGAGGAILSTILAIVIIAAIGVGGWFAYDHFSGSAYAGTWKEKEGSERIILHKNGTVSGDDMPDGLNVIWKKSGDEIIITFSGKKDGAEVNLNIKAKILNKNTFRVTMADKTSEYIKTD